MPIRRLSAQLVCAALVACGLATIPVEAAEKSPQKQFGVAKPDSALVYLIREKRFTGSARTMFVYADEQFLGTLDNDSYTFADLAPGKHLLWLNWAKVNSEVELAAGKTYYFAIWGSFDPLDEVSGQAYLKGIGSYATPEPKELEKSAEQIRERFGKATASAAKKPKDAPQATNLDRRAKHIAEWPKVDLRSYPVLCIEEFVMADPKAAARKQGYLVEAAPHRMLNLVIENLGSGVFREVRQGAHCEPEPEEVLLRARITQYKPGSETARLMLAGAGSAQLEMQVTLVDAASGKSLAQFEAKGLWAWGGALGASRGIADLEKNVAFEVASYLKNGKGIELEAGN